MIKATATLLILMKLNN